MFGSLNSFKLLHFIVAGFVIVLVPITSVLVYSGYQLGEFSKDYRETLITIRLVSAKSQSLLDGLMDIECLVAMSKDISENDWSGQLQTLFVHINTVVHELEPSLKGRPTLLRLLSLSQQLKELVDSRIFPAGSDHSDLLDSISRLRFAFRKELQGIRDWLHVEMSRLEIKVVLIQKSIIWQVVLIIPVTVILMLILLQLINRPIQDLHGAILSLGTIGFNRVIQVKGARDFTELGQRLEDLRQRQQKLEDNNQKFLRHMSHELKTPLASLKEGIDLLIEGVAGTVNESQREILIILQNNIIDLKMSIENIIDYSRFRSDITIVPAQIFPGRLFREAIEKQKIRVISKRLQVTFEGDESVFVLGDKVKIRSAIENIVSNAINYSPVNGLMQCRWEHINDLVRIEIVDDGPGIETKDIEKIFKPFYQGGIAREGSVKGSGLGLSIVNEAVRAHHGKVEVENVHGRGALFRIYLPVNALSRIAPVKPEGM